MSRRDSFEWDYYSESQPRRVDGGLKTRKERGVIGETWWSKRWLHVLEEMGMGTRLTRGRSYARQGQVLSIEIQSGQVKARVQGSLKAPYQITIKLPTFSDPDWQKVIKFMASQAVFAAKLLSAEMPTTIEEAFGAVNLSLFPSSEKDLTTKCSCPDWANPCKHIAAVYYILAEQFDLDPFLLFTLRGRSKEAIIEALRKMRAETLLAERSTSLPVATESRVDEEYLQLEDLLATFWQAGEGLNTFAINLQQPDVDKALLKRLGVAPFSVANQNVSLLLETAYTIVQAVVLEKARTLQTGTGSVIEK